ncbi:MAG: response regulator [bacterium]
MVKKKILIVEDEEPMARALVLKLNKEGYEAISAENGAKALEVLDKEKFDLILLDLMMPKLDGFGVMAEMKKRKIKIPVIVSSNLSQESDFKKAKEMGAKDFFVKSDTPLVQVIEHIKEAL